MVSFFRGKDESILVVVDTGFNGDFMVSRDAARLLGVDPISTEAEIELGDGRTVRVNEADRKSVV